MKKSPKLKKFRVSFEVEAIPYNKNTYKLLGPYFFKEWPDTIYVKEDLSDLISNARCRLLDQILTDKESGVLDDSYKQQLEFINSFSQFKVESI